MTSDPSLAARLRDVLNKALKRINALPTFDDPDAMGACLSDVEEILKGGARLASSSSASARRETGVDHG